MPGPLRNLPVAKKLFAGFGVLCALMVAIGLTGITEVKRADQRLETVYRANMYSLELIGKLRADVQQARALTSTLILHSPAADIGNIEQALLRQDAALDGHWREYAADAALPAAKQTFETALAEYRSVRTDVLLPAARAEDMNRYLAGQTGRLDPAADRMMGALNNLAQAEDASVRQQMAAARAASNRAVVTAGVLIGSAVLIALVLGVALTRSLSRPLRRTVEVLEGLAEGRLDQRLDVPGRDEVGRMASALNTALDRLSGALRGINANVDTLTTSSEALSTVAGQMSASATRSAGRASAVSTASSEINRNIETLSSGAEEMGASIGEIARSTASAADVASSAVRISSEAGDILSKLGESSAEIVSVVKMITSIAEQTNLLALNATIEAARAGEAGKGFAVVAGEVKDLAAETARATDDIRTRVGAIQSDSAAAVAAIAEIGAVIDQINATQSAIAAAVEEQTATTDEMSRNVRHVATGTGEISANVAEVAEAAEETTGAATHTASAADELATVAGELRRSLSMFRY